MRDKLFFDTNIICYAFDLAEPAKRKVCKKLMEKVFSGEILGVVSNQVLGEVFNAAVTKIHMPEDKASIIVKSLIASDKWEKVAYNHITVNRTINDFIEYNAPFWDLLIAETMKENGITEIVTENERDFSKIPGIRLTNPFKNK
jgi:predicted nucleic acid-binding protein